MTKMITGLLLVLAIIIAIAWLLKRFALIPTSATGHIKIVAATNVGQRERVIIVEIGEAWLVLGVAPGQVHKLHAMDKPSQETADAALKNTSSQFSEKLDNRLNSANND